MIKRNAPLKRTALPKRRTPLSRANLQPLKRTPIARVSKRRGKQLREYSSRRKAFLDAHPVCEVWCSENGWRWIGAREYGWSGGMLPQGPTELFSRGAPAADQIHHKNKRHGARLNDEAEWLAVCAANHERIELNKAWARERGFLRDI